MAIIAIVLKQGLTEKSRKTMNMDDFIKAYKITNREHEIIDLLTKSLQYKEIAEKLNISFETVKSHASNIYQKTGAKGKMDLKHILQNYRNE